jgi:hypothetical protein
VVDEAGAAALSADAQIPGKRFLGSSFTFLL